MGKKVALRAGRPGLKKIVQGMISGRRIAARRQGKEDGRRVTRDMSSKRQQLMSGTFGPPGNTNVSTPGVAGNSGDGKYWTLTG